MFLPLFFKKKQMSLVDVFNDHSIFTYNDAKGKCKSLQSFKNSLIPFILEKKVIYLASKDVNSFLMLNGINYNYSYTKDCIVYIHTDIFISDIAKARTILEKRGYEEKVKDRLKDVFKRYFNYLTYSNIGDYVINIGLVGTHNELFIKLKKEFQNLNNK